MFGKDHKWRNNFILLKEQVQTRRDAIFAWEQENKIYVEFTSVLEFKLFKTHRTFLDWIIILIQKERLKKKANTANKRGRLSSCQTIDTERQDSDKAKEGYE